MPERAPGYLAALLARRDPLLPRMLEFSGYPARYAHPTWLPPEWAEARRFSGARWDARLSRMLLERLGIPDQEALDFAPPSHRLALADGAVLERAAYLAGLAALAPEISRELERRKVLALMDELGPEDYRFALRKAPLLSGGTLASAYRPPEGTWRGRAFAAGMRLLGACFGSAPEALRARLKLKLPRPYAPDLDAGAAAGPDHWPLFRRLLRETDPAWTDSFS